MAKPIIWSSVEWSDGWIYLNMGISLIHFFLQCASRADNAIIKPTATMSAEEFMCVSMRACTLDFVSVTLSTRILETQHCLPRLRVIATLFGYQPNPDIE